MSVLWIAACGYPKLPELGGDGGMPDASHSDAGADSNATDGPGADASSAKDLTSLVFRASDNPTLLGSDVTATINGNMVTATVPLGANESLVATYTTTGASVEVDGTAQTSGVTANDFFGPVTYRVVAGDGSTADYTVIVTAPSAQQAYVKASNTNANDYFGTAIALSSDGNTLAVSATGEASAATGVGGSQEDNSAGDAGAVYVFTRSGTLWHQQAYIKASNTGANDSFGTSIALSADGNTLAVGASGESSAATGVNGNGSDNSAPIAGAVYVFSRNGTTWSQQAYVKASNTAAYDGFGRSVAVSADGNTLAVGATGEDSAATGVNGNQADNSANAAGAAYVFTRTGTTWSQQAYVKASNTAASNEFGCSVALSGSGNLLAVSADYEASAATGVGGNQSDRSAGGAGAVYVFGRSGASWSQDAYIKASNTNAGDNFGAWVALSGDGSTLAVSAPYEASLSAGINGDQTDNSGDGAGAVYVFTVSGTTWSQQAYVKASNPDASVLNETEDNFGAGLALSYDGATLAVGASGEQSAATGLDGNQADNSANDAGAGYLFTRSGTSWRQEAYVKASNTGSGDGFGAPLTLSGDGHTLAVGAGGEASDALGVNGNQADDSAFGAGAVYVFQ